MIYNKKHAKACLPVFVTWIMLCYQNTANSRSATAGAIKFRSRLFEIATGYISEENLEKLKVTAVIVVSGYGSGKIISFIDDPNFRAFCTEPTSCL